MCGVDGSALAQTALEYTLTCLMQQDKRHVCEVVHVKDSTKVDLPPKWRPDAVQADCEAKITSSVSLSRGRFKMLHKTQLKSEDSDDAVGYTLLEEADKFEADFIVMGFLGRKRSQQSTAGIDLGRPQTKGRPSSSSGQRVIQSRDSLRRMYSIHPISSNNMIVMSQSKAGIIILHKDHTESRGVLPAGRPARFVVSVSLNAAATQAFLDALRLSKSGDFIDVVYVKSFMEETESDYTRALREKYDSFFAGLQGSTNSEQFTRFQDRICTFRFLEKRKGKSTAQEVADYADGMNADFLVVGTNVMRGERGKTVLGSVSAEVVLETASNVVVSHYIAENFPERRLSKADL